MNEPIQLVPGKSDAEMAVDFRKRIIELYEPLLELLTEANNKGFAINVGCGLDGLGRIAILQLQISKVFK